MDSINIPLSGIALIITIGVQVLKTVTPQILKLAPGLTPFLPMIIAALLQVAGALGEDTTVFQAAGVGAGSSWLFNVINGFARQVKPLLSRL